MSPDEARALIAHPSIANGGPQVWADLGCGDGTFTAGLASLLPAGSTVHAMDHDARALSRVPPRHHDVAIVTHPGDFTVFPWPFANLDGVLMANSLHYVQEQAAFLRNVVRALRQRRILLVEYDMTRGNAWVPYPIDRTSAVALFRSIGFSRATTLGRHRSVYRRGEIYGLLLTA
ncbi:MAG TPA: class I SAM-dependent methyltransferase [Vicinamibacterales bacterium]|nr:class I SAM-dependent methyltransferase [Vicinamibacterales bacterium]